MSDLAARLAGLSPAQRELLLRRMQQQKSGETAPVVTKPPAAIPRRAVTSELPPASLAQARLWFLDRLSPGAASYNLTTHLRLAGALAVPALARALAALGRRHESLRTSLAEVGGLPVQVIVSPETPPGPLPVIDLSGLAAADREPLAVALASAEADRPLALDRGPLWRRRLARLGPEDHLLMVTIHHAVFDAWSSGVFLRELGELYATFARGAEPDLPELPLQYADYALWHRAWVASPEAQRQVAFWQEALAGLPPVLELPTDRPRPAVQSFRGARVTFAAPGLAGALRPLLRRERASLFMALSAGLQVLLARLSGERDFAVGSPVANRSRPELAGLVGFFVNTVPLRSRLRDGDPSFTALLAAVRDHALDAFAHQEAPFESIVERLRLERSPAHNPVFQSMLVLQNAPEAANRLGDLAATGVEGEMRAARFDLTFSFTERGDDLEGVLDYATDLFDATTARRGSAALVRLLAAAAADPEQAVSALPAMSAAERAQVGSEWSDGLGRVGTASDEAVLTLWDLFARQAARTPEREAIAAGTAGENVALRYGELHARALALAARLRAAGVGPEVPVGVALDRSPELAVAVLAILAAGGAYLPLDPTQPRERLAGLLADAGATVTLTRRGLLADLADLPGLLLATEDEPLATSAGLAGPPSPDHLAYVIYTSGSTGKPKGVMVSHRSAVPFALDFAARHGFAGHRVLMIPPLFFDASVGDLFPAFATGATLVLHPAPGELDGRGLAAFCARLRVTAIDAPAALWSRWVEEWEALGEADPLPGVTLMMIGGEAVAPERMRAWHRLTAGRAPIFNHYGPTEATVCALVERAGPERAGEELPIGRPISEVSAHVVDRQRRPVAIGVAGELYLGGSGIARGYLGRPALTAQVFVPDPFSPLPGARLYRTGDLARSLADGRLSFLGRGDQQIKLRGFRIEPGEIESVLGELPAVRGAAVVLRDGAQAGDRRLVAYLVTEPPADLAAWTRELHAFLSQRLPAYMVPAAFVPLAALPLTGNGKLDRRALPEPALPARERVAPRNPTEEALVALWAETLGLPAAEVGITDDFFALGGQSLGTIALLTRVRQGLGVDLPLTAIFQAPTPEGFAALVARARSGQPALAAIDWGAEAALPAEIDPRGLPAAASFATARCILLTGATGFLGAYLLAELLRRTEAEIVCLARASSPAEALARVRKNLDLYGLRERFGTRWPAAERRIVPLAGDLAEPRLGLGAERFEALAGEVEAIVHNGGAVNFLAPYERLKPTNVLGTLEILRLATRGRAKAVHFVSTLGLFLVPSRLGITVRESDPPLPGAAIDGGYNQSKWVAEQWVLAAGRRGLPVAVYRPARISGDSETGACNAGDVFYSWLAGSAALGAVANPPDSAHPETLDLAPVDFVAAAIVELALAAEPGGSYHFFNPATLPVAVVAERLRARGYAMRELPYATWLAELRAAVATPESNPMAPFASLYADEVDAREPVFDCRATFDAVAPAGIVCPPADARLLDTYLDALERMGALPVPAEEVAK